MTSGEPARRCGTGIAISSGMDTTFMPLTAVVSQQKTRSFDLLHNCDQLVHWKSLALPAIGIVLWLAVGCWLTWLLADFNRALAPETSFLPPSLIFAGFLGCAFVIGAFSWRSARNAAAR